MLNINEGFVGSDDINKYFTLLTSDNSYNYYSLNSNKKFTLNNSINISSVVDNNFANSTMNLNNYLNTNKKLLSKYISDTSLNVYNVTTVDSFILDLSSNPADISNNNTVNMIFVESSNNFYDFSGELLSNFYLKIDNKDIINNGQLVDLPPTSDSVTSTASIDSAIVAQGGQGGSFSMGDINFPGLYGNTLEFSNNIIPGQILRPIDDYMLNQGNFNTIFPQNIQAPIYNNFEAAMNMPSNPIMNPVNSMNPLQYAESLFGPNVTPMMVKNAFLNQNTTDNCSKTCNNNNSNSCNNSDNNSNSNSNSNSNDISPPVQKIDHNERFTKPLDYTPESNDGVLPRPILTDFSSFGM
jgi:hypothetical protein